MADNTILNPGSGGDTIRAKLISGVKTQLVQVDIGGELAEVQLVAGQTTMSASVPVAIASDQSAVPVSAASLPLPTGAATAAKQPALGTAGTASADVITVQGITSMTALKVDGSASTQPVSGTVTANAGTGTFAVSAASLPLPTGAATAANQTSVQGTVGVGTAPADMVVGGALYNSVEISPTTGQSFSLQADSKGRLRNVIMDAAGNTRGVNVTAGNALTVDGSATTQPVSGTVTANQGGTWTVQPGNTANTTAWKVDGSAVTQPVSGTVTANAGTGTFAVSAASLPLPTGAATAANQTSVQGTIGAGTAPAEMIVGGAIYNSTEISPTTGQSFALQADSKGRQRHVLMDGAGNTRAANVTTGNALVVDGSASTQPVSGTVTANAGTGTFNIQANASVNLAQVAGVSTVTGGVNGSQSVGGPTASGSSIAANPVTQGGRAATANPTAVADGQVVNTMHDKLGKLVAVGAIRTLKGTQKTTITASTSETTIVTAVASTFLDLYGLVLANTGSSTTKVDIRDTTAGSVIATFEVPTLETRGFMLPVDSAIAQTTVNTNWTAQCGTSTSSLEVTALYVKNI